jgi:hypothetical protein
MQYGVMGNEDVERFLAEQKAFEEKRQALIAALLKRASGRTRKSMRSWRSSGIGRIRMRSRAAIRKKTPAEKARTKNARAGCSNTINPFNAITSASAWLFREPAASLQFWKMPRSDEGNCVRNNFRSSSKRHPKPAL